MKCFKRFFSLFLCLLLCCGLFSVPVSADALDVSSYKVNIFSEITGVLNLSQIDINNGESGYKAYGGNVTWQNKNYQFRSRLTFADSQGGAIFKAGNTYTFTVDNLFSMFGASVSASDLTPVFSRIGGLDLYWVQMKHADGSESDNFMDDFTYTFNPTTDTYSLKGTFKPDKDVHKIVFYLESYFNPSTDFSSNLIGKTSNFTAYFGTYPESDDPLKLDISVQSEEAGLLSGLLGWVQNIFDKLDETWKVLSAGFANLVQGITELPQKLWSAIETGLKNLFVPDDQYMTTYKDRWDELLSSRLGAVYEVCAIVTESWDNVINADNTNSISIPTVTIPLSNSSFTFGGYNVKIVPDGFGVLVDALKLIVGIVCTYLFVNGLLKRYDEVMGVEK